MPIVSSAPKKLPQRTGCFLNDLVTCRRLGAQSNNVFNGFLVNHHFFDVSHPTETTFLKCGMFWVHYRDDTKYTSVLVSIIS